MAITKVNPPSWGVNTILTSAQMNLVDTKLITATDNTAAGDTILGPWQMSTAGRVVPSIDTLGFNGNHTYTINTGTQNVLVTSFVGANFTYTLGSAGAVSGDVIEFHAASNFTFEITIVDAGAPATTLFLLGNLSTSDGTTAKFVFAAGAWKLFGQSQGSRTFSQAFAVSGAWVCPRGVTSVTVTGYGGGGGGGSGPNGTTTNTTVSSGGAGGGGSIASTVILPVTPGTSYTVTIGAGGTGGASASAAGANGGDTSFGSLAVFLGASGGAQGFTVTAALGGAPVRQLADGAGAPGYGGNGGAHAGGALGRLAAVGNGASVGIAGSVGADSGAFFGGGGGGSGGAAANSDANIATGTGGTGGIGNNAGAGNNANGGNGANLVPTAFGCGGGGGGAGGNGSTAGGAFGAGGNGAAGRLTVMWVK